MTHFVRAGLLSVSALLLVACAGVPERGVVVFDDRVKGIESISPWGFRGRVSIVHQEQGWHASLQWHEHRQDYRLSVAGPLGQGAFELYGGPSGVTLRDAGGRIQRDSDADALFLSVTGMALPVSGLRYWVRGLPVPGVEAALDYDPAGRLTGIRQSGWELRYDRFGSFSGYSVPGRLKMARDGLDVKLVIDEWLPADTAAVP